MQVNIRLGMAKIRPQLSGQSHCISSQLFGQSVVCSDAADDRIAVSRSGSSANENVTINVPIGTKPLLDASRKEAAVPNCQSRMGFVGPAVWYPYPYRAAWDIVGYFCMLSQSLR